MTEKLLIGLAIGTTCAVAAYLNVPWQEILEAVTEVVR